MKVECFVLGGQTYAKDDKVRTLLRLVTVSEGKGYFGYDHLGSVSMDGDFSYLSPMQPAVANGSFVRFGENQSFRIHDIELM